MLITLFAILKARGGFILFNVSLPKQRLAMIVERPRKELMLSS
jgi:hypothetical protein